MSKVFSKPEITVTVKPKMKLIMTTEGMKAIPVTETMYGNPTVIPKPLSKADIAALFLKLDKATFNEFEDIFQRFHDKVESKLSDLDAITKTTFSLATSNEERIFQLEKDLEELRDYLDAEIHRVHHSLSNTQVDLILQLISDTFDTQDDNCVAVL